MAAKTGSPTSEICYICHEEISSKNYDYIKTSGT